MANPGDSTGTALASGPTLVMHYQQATRYDKIILANGETLVVSLKDSSEAGVSFSYPLNSRVEKLGRNEIAGIVPAGGPAIAMPGSNANESGNNWEEVSLLLKPVDAGGAKNLGEIDARFEGDQLNASSEYLEKNALIILRKKALHLGANAIYITGKNEYRAFGDLPYISLKAVAVLK